MPSYPYCTYPLAHLPAIIKSRAGNDQQVSHHMMHATNLTFGMSPMHTGTPMDRVRTCFPVDPSLKGTTLHPCNYIINTECPVTINICPSFSSKCQGTRRYFELCKSATCLMSFRMTGWHKLNENNSSVGFLECTQFVSSGIDRHTRRACIVYHLAQKNDYYFLGWVHSIVYADVINTIDDVLHVYLWNRKVKEDEHGCSYPSVFDVHTADE